MQLRYLLLTFFLSTISARPAPTMSVDDGSLKRREPVPTMSVDEENLEKREPVPTMSVDEENLEKRQPVPTMSVDDESLEKRNPVDYGNIDWAHLVNWNTVNYGGAAAAAATTTVAPAAAAPAATTQAAATQAVAKAVTVQKSTKSSNSGSSGSSSSLSGAGIAFSQYQGAPGSSSCKSASELASDIQKLSSYSIIRLYDVDCDLVSIALKNKKKSQKIIAGIYNPDQWQAGVKAIQSAVSANGNDWSSIYAVSVGNEHVNDGKMTSGQMKNYVSQVKSAIGNNVKVAAVDVYSVIYNHDGKNGDKGLCSGDIVLANAHPYFDTSSDPSACGTWLQTQVSKLKNYCGKDVLITETGWPTAGGNRASKGNQNTCISAIKGNSVKDQSILFTAWDESWKTSELERHWGIMS